MGWRLAIMKEVALVLAALGLAAVLGTKAASADDGFPFGLDMMLDAPPMAGSKRIPTLEIGESGEAQLGLWCKSGKGQFSVAGNTVIFVPGALEERECTPVRSAADDALVANLGEATNWKRQGDFVSFVGPKTLRFRLNTN